MLVFWDWRMLEFPFICLLLWWVILCFSYINDFTFLLWVGGSVKFLICWAATFENSSMILVGSMRKRVMKFLLFKRLCWFRLRLFFMDSISWAGWFLSKNCRAKYIYRELCRTTDTFWKKVCLRQCLKLTPTFVITFHFFIFSNYYWCRVCVSVLHR